MLRPLVVVAFLLAAPCGAGAQQPPVTRLTAPDAQLKEPFTQIDGVRSLRDGRVIVLDGLELTLSLADPGHGTVQSIGRKGSGPGEYQRPTGIFPWRGDTSALYDIAARRVLLILPDGRPGASFNPRAVAGGVQTITLLNAPRAFDGRGFMYTAAQPVRRSTSRGEITLAESSAIERWPRGAAKRDTVAWLNLREDPSRRLVPGVGVMWSPSHRAFQTDDQWTVAPDGRIALVTSAPYRVDFVFADGRMQRGLPIPYERIRVTDAHRKQFFRELERPGIAVVFKDGQATTQLTKPAPVREADWNFPEELPPFLQTAISFSPDGYLWVRRTTEASAPPTWDLINTSGIVTERVELPIGSRIVGFGPGVVYAARVDDDDLQYLQRYRFTPKTRP